MIAKTMVIANSVELKRSRKPTDRARAETIALCELGKPPEATVKLHSQSCSGSTTNAQIGFNNCALTAANIAQNIICIVFNEINIISL